MNIQKPLLLTVMETSKILRINRTKVYILIETGALSAIKVGSDWRIRTNSVERLSGELPLEVFSDTFVWDAENAMQNGAPLDS